MYRVSLSPAIQEKPKERFNWNAFQNGITQHELKTRDELLAAIESGQAFGAIFNGKPTTENFTESWIIAIDYDCGDQRAALTNLRKIDVVKKYAAFAYTTMSHQVIKPRARVVYILDQPFCDAEEYKRAARAISQMHDGAEHESQLAHRMWYGSYGCDYWWNNHAGDIRLPRRVVQLAVMANKINEKPKPTQYQAPTYGYQAPTYGGAKGMSPNKLAASIMLDELRMLEGQQQVGGRNHQLNRCAFVAGQLVGGGYIQQQVLDDIRAIAHKIGLGELEIKRTIESGFQNGLDQPKRL